ncbi:two-component system OmpR family sensor kinase [Nocardioides zeae]|uniref:Two-component system OmpR family sensor kinase n=1 Tax=Nocardioides zeae TaxID=1457234 RepID=A0ACC6IKY2_9ACTN|nr:HAMP domain-containing sensor histidine kinase [Nocardioides zeae]MDR6175158.1 two-component system OmpR family sensor kinase [Nocardioides zeae]MDR6211349.1 two-component system OmpR family sensor kinase [Nocardioides zeae]
MPTTSPAPVRRRLATLTSRLVLATVLLTTLLALAIGTATTLAMRANLTDRLDDEVTSVVPRAGGGSFRPPDGDRPPGATAGSTTGGCDRFVPGNQGPGTLLAVLPDGSATADGARGGVLTEQVCGERTLATAALEQLADVPADGAVHAVDLVALGSYRVVATRADDGTVVVAGLPTDAVDDAVRSLVGYELLIGLVAVLLAGGAATLVVRRQLRPLRDVAATAHEVTTLPLAEGEVDLAGRVPAHLRDERTEVGQVGAALDTLLAHVDAAMAARHRSEQQVRQFVADASHELRTPLATIVGYAELARRRPDDADAARTALAKVEGESGRMRRLVEDLLMLARLDAGRPLGAEPVDLTMLLLEAVEDARVLAPGHRWRLDLPDAAVELTGDGHGLHQVVTNLLSNARRYTPGGTTVKVTAALEADRVVLRVHDDGPGFSPELAASAFDRFVRGDTARVRGDGPEGGPEDGAAGGSGLGLALVRAIVEAHGGTVALDSRPGDTTITVALPR